MIPRLSNLNTSQNLFSVYLRGCLCYDEVATSKIFDLEIKTKGPKAEALEPESIGANPKFCRPRVNLSLPYEGFFLLEFNPYARERGLNFLSNGAMALTMQENVARRSL